MLIAPIQRLQPQQWRSETQPLSPTTSGSATSATAPTLSPSRRVNAPCVAIREARAARIREIRIRRLLGYFLIIPNITVLAC
jgi:hypothetical protein